MWRISTVFLDEGPGDAYFYQPAVYGRLPIIMITSANGLVTELPAHSMGLKSLFPLWALTGLKFIKPRARWIVPYYTAKEELTTVTLFYDAYYDFGVVGVFLFSSAVLGLFAAWLMEPGRQIRSGSFLFPGGALFHAVIFCHLVFQSGHLVLFCSHGSGDGLGGAHKAAGRSRGKDIKGEGCFIWGTIRKRWRK